MKPKDSSGGKEGLVSGKGNSLTYWLIANMQASQKALVWHSSFLSFLYR